MTTTVLVPVPTVRRKGKAVSAAWSTNQRIHQYDRNERAQAWRDSAALAARGVGELPPSFVLVTIPFPTRLRRDGMNYTGTVSKAIVDGLVDAGVWPDDNQDYVWAVATRWVAAADTDTPDDVVVEIMPV